MTLYRVIPWKEEDDCDFSLCTSWAEAKELGDEYYPEGYDVESVDPEDL